MRRKNPRKGEEDTEVPTVGGRNQGKEGKLLLWKGGLSRGLSEPRGKANEKKNRKIIGTETKKWGSIGEDNRQKVRPNRSL